MSRVRWTKTNCPSHSRTGGCNEAWIPHSLDWVLAAGNLSFHTGLNSKADTPFEDSLYVGILIFYIQYIAADVD